MDNIKLRSVGFMTGLDKHQTAAEISVVLY